MNNKIFEHLMQDYYPRKFANYFFMWLIKIPLYLLGYVVIKQKDFANENLTRWDIRLTFYYNFFKQYLSNRLTIFDVGAHKGESVFYYKSLFNDSKIFSFEPDKNIFTELEKFISFQKYNDVKCFNYALGSKNQIKEYYLLKQIFNTTGSSFVKPTNSNEIDKISNYAIKTGDDFCNKEKIKNIDILKINVQGMEIEVLEGFKQVLKNNIIRIILAEFDYSERYTSKMTIGNLENFLDKYNYSLFDIVLLKRSKLKHRKKNRGIKIKHGYVLFINQELYSKTKDL